MKCKGSREQDCQLSRERKHSSNSWTCLAWRGGLTKNWAATCTCSTSWIPWHLFLGTWGVGLYWSGKTWGQSHKWWALQGEVLENPSTYGRWGSCSHERDASSGHDFAQARACGAMLLWLVCKKDGGLHASALTSINWMWEPRRTFTHSHRYRKWWRASVGAGYFSCLDLRQGFGRLQWMRLKSNTPLLLWET